MRDNHVGYPELLDADERDGLYFGAVRVTVSDEVASFEFGVEQRGYVALKQILQTRPFDPLGKHRGICSREISVNVSLILTRSALTSVSSKVLTAKSFENFRGPVWLVNLLWFQSLKDLQDTAALKRLS